MVRHYKRKTDRASAPDDVKLLAVRYVKILGKSLRSTARLFNMDYRTLSRYCKKIPMHEIVDEATSVTSSPLGYRSYRHIFNEEQEKKLVSYIEKASDIYFGLTPTEVRMLTYQFSVALKVKIPDRWNETNMAGPDWFTAFHKRHPLLAIRTAEITSLARTKSFNRHNVQVFFDNLKKIMLKYQFGPDDIWNMDETAVTNTVVARRDVKQIESLASAEEFLVTVACCVSATGKSIPPYFVFPTVRYKDDFLQNGPVGSTGGSSISGWMKESNFDDFLSHFAGSTKCSKQSPSLLLLHNHSSYLSVKGIDYAEENGIVMLSFPPYCSHKLQPLDRTVYGPFKEHINSASESWVMQNPGKSMTIYDIPGLVARAFPLAATPENIQSGFRVSGIYPFNQEIFNESEFSLSFLTDRSFSLQSTSTAPSSSNTDTDQQSPGSSAQIKDEIEECPIKDEIEEYLKLFQAMKAQSFAEKALKNM